MQISFRGTQWTKIFLILHYEKLTIHLEHFVGMEDFRVIGVSE